MFPLLRDGDVIDFKKILPKDIKFNDIILIYRNGVFITHRIVYVSKKYVIARGDNNKQADKQLPKESILAKAIRFKRNGIWYDIQDVYSSQSLTYIVEIRRLATELNTAKIGHVFLKGVMISLRYESHIPQRIYSDCDILIQREQFDELKDVFKKLGYKKIVDPTMDSLSDKESPEVSFVRIVGGIPVIFDVHLEPVFLMTKLSGMNLLYPKKERELLGEKLISQSKKVKIGGFAYSLLTPAMQILYLALHIFHHNFTDIVRLKLLDSVIRKSSKQKRIWNEFCEVIIEFSLQRYITPILFQLKTYFKTPIPKIVFTQLEMGTIGIFVNKYMISKVDIFSEEYRIKEGIYRFIFILLLSPEPLYKKLLLIIHPSTIQSIIWVIGKRTHTILGINT